MKYKVTLSAHGSKPHAQQNFDNYTEAFLNFKNECITAVSYAKGVDGWNLKICLLKDNKLVCSSTFKMPKQF